MKEKMKKILKNRIFIFALGLSIAGSISVAAETFFPSNDVTYDNTESGLASTNVQGAIDELYNTCFPKGPLDGTVFEDKVVTSGDGLYEDEYEEGRYIFKGGNPNNYITFNNEEAGWRILSIEPDGKLKIMQIKTIREETWDSSYSNNWSRPASLNTYLNGTYYNRLTDIAKQQIVASDFSIGGITDNNNDMKTQVSDENSSKWNGKVALATVSEYIRSCNNNSSCKTLRLYGNNYTTCRDTTWMYEEAWWTLTPDSSRSSYVFIVNMAGDVVNSNTINNSFTINVHPVVYLSSDIKITGGDGSQSNPYQISL